MIALEDARIERFRAKLFRHLENFFPATWHQTEKKEKFFQDGLSNAKKRFIETEQDLFYFFCLLMLKGEGFLHELDHFLNLNDNHRRHIRGWFKSSFYQTVNRNQSVG